MRKSRKLGKTGDVAVSVLFCFFFGFSDFFSSDYQLRHVQGPKRSLCLRVSDGMQDLKRTKSLVFVLGQAKTQGRD
jgi:hypothetical protein